MEKPHSFAGRYIQKNGKTITNDYAQPEKFFADMGSCLRLIEEVPFSAIEDLQKYELNRDVMINILKRVCKILNVANVDVYDELQKQHENDPFNGLEEDIAAKKKIKISGEEN